MLSGATSSEAQQTNAQNQKFILAPRCAAGTKVGVVGLGGLGHLALQFAAKLGAEVSLLSRPGVHDTGRPWTPGTAIRRQAGCRGKLAVTSWCLSHRGTLSEASVSRKAVPEL